MHILVFYYFGTVSICIIIICVNKLIKRIANSRIIRIKKQWEYLEVNRK